MLVSSLFLLIGAVSAGSRQLECRPIKEHTSLSSKSTTKAYTTGYYTSKVPTTFSTKTTTKYTTKDTTKYSTKDSTTSTASYTTTDDETTTTTTTESTTTTDAATTTTDSTTTTTESTTTTTDATTTTTTDSTTASSTTTTTTTTTATAAATPDCSGRHGYTNSAGGVSTSYYNADPATANFASCKALVMASGGSSFAFGGGLCLGYAVPVSQAISESAASPYEFYDISCTVPVIIIVTTTTTGTTTDAATTTTMTTTTTSGYTSILHLP